MFILSKYVDFSVHIYVYQIDSIFVLILNSHIYVINKIKQTPNIYRPKLCHMIYCRSFFLKFIYFNLQLKKTSATSKTVVIRDVRGAIIQ